MEINFDKYYPLENDPSIPMEEKKIMMHERRTRVFTLMIEFGVTRNMIKHAMQSDLIQFRSGNEIFFDLLEENDIPLVIFSASGLGSDGIYFCLEKQHKLYDNIEVIANRFIRDESGKAIAVKDPIIHSFNKGETIVKDFPIYEKIKDRLQSSKAGKNIILLGDSLGDADMADGCEYQNIIKIGFLNKDTPENREKFQEKFDLVILNDGPMDEVNNILKQII